MTNLNKSKKDWEKNTLNKALKKHSEQKKEFKTDSDITIDRLYLPSEEESYNEKIGFPGDFPYTRGVQPTM